MSRVRLGTAMLAALAGLGVSEPAPPPDLAALAPPPPGVDAREIALRAEESLRSDRTYMEATMTVVSPRLAEPRDVRFRSWDDRPERRSFIRIDAPAKDAGTGFLKLHPNLWMYVPRVERTLRIPPSMMLQPWMGSDFTNDDLVKESSQIDDYEHRVLGVDEGVGDGRRAYVVEYVPHEETAVVWGKILTWIEIEHGTPLRQDFYDEAGERIRSMRFEAVREVGGRHVPHRWIMTPLDKEGHETRIEVHEFGFDAKTPDSVFTTRHLRERD